MVSKNQVFTLVRQVNGYICIVFLDNMHSTQITFATVRALMNILRVVFVFKNSVQMTGGWSAVIGSVAASNGWRQDFSNAWERVLGQAAVLGGTSVYKLYTLLTTFVPSKVPVIYGLLYEAEKIYQQHVSGKPLKGWSCTGWANSCRNKRRDIMHSNSLKRLIRTGTTWARGCWGTWRKCRKNDNPELSVIFGLTASYNLVIATRFNNQVAFTWF